MRYTKLLVFLLSLKAPVMANSKNLPILKTKQSLVNIRMISNTGKYTYYQQRSGNLQLSTNYSNSIVLDYPNGTNFLMNTSFDGKLMAISVDNSHQTKINFFKENDIFTLKMGDDKPTRIGTGRYPEIHQQNRWISFFKPRLKQIVFQSLFAKDKRVIVKLRSKINPYFIPEVEMINTDTVLYTDLNETGYSAVIMYNFADKTFKTVYKSKFPGTKLDYCIQDDQIILGEFSLDYIMKGSSILSIPLYDNKEFKKSKNLYNSEHDDIGNMVCDESIVYFIKTLDFNKHLNLKHTELAKLEIKTGKITIMSELRYVTNLLRMDSMILIPFRDNFYIVKGNQEHYKDSLKKSGEK